METIASAGTCLSLSIPITTKHPTEFIDITDRLSDLVEIANLQAGILNVQTLHTTTAVLVNENEPLLRDDFCCLLEGIAPAGRRYRHDDLTIRTQNLTDAERPNGHAHCRALLLPTSVCLNVARGRLVLGMWQRVFFAELDGPRERTVSVVALGEVSR